MYHAYGSTANFLPEGPTAIICIPKEWCRYVEQHGVGNFQIYQLIRELGQFFGGSTQCEWTLIITVELVIADMG